MLNPLLPSLIPGHNVTNFNKPGDWEPRYSTELENISEGLNVKIPKGTPSEVDSIPSMWARPLLFQMALYDDKHPVHTQVLGEWRGLLAMLALKEWSEFPITTEQVEIDVAKNPEGAADFLRALAKLRPTDTLSDLRLPDPATWEVLNIILFDGKPIGIASPTTLVCTAVDCRGRIPSSVPWFDKGKFLVNPVQKLNVYEKEAVKYWLEKLHGGTGVLPNSNIKASLRTLLTDFINDLKPPPAIDGGFALSKNSLNFAQVLFTNLNYSVAPPKDLESSIELVRSENKQSKKKLLVFDEDIHKAWGVDPQDVIVWKGKTLATSQSFSGTPNLKLPRGVELQTPQDFFTDKLLVIDEAKAFDETGTLVSKGSEDINFNGISVTPILPLTTELLTYLDVKDLNHRITFNQLNDRIVVKLCLTLKGINENPKDFEISKEYAAEQIKQLDFLPVLAIWPNFMDPKWKAYYTYFTKDDQDTFYAKPFLTDGQFVSRQLAEGKKEITKTETFPEAMICKYGDNHAGLLLISVPEPLENKNGNEWTVGVDFGTSSTTVYYRADNRKKPQPLPFENRLFHITNTGKTTLFYDDFLSPKDEKSPFLSLFQKFECEETEAPLLDGHIYFLENYSRLKDPTKIVSDLKWSDRAKQYIEVFLKQLCLQVAAEAIDDGAGTIHWNFSHPLAFSERDKGTFERIWNAVGSDTEQATGMSQQIANRAQSESVVAAKFFADTLQHEHAVGGFASGAVCIDIGGETSDISIWQNNELYWQTSIRFAGRHIFLNLLKENPEFLKGLGVDDSEINLLKKASEGTNDMFYAQADALIQDQDKDWRGKLKSKGDGKGIKPFVQLVSLGFAGLLYYVGLLLNYISKHDSDFKSEIPSIYIGGNGSKILHWIAAGDFNHDRIASNCRENLKKVILEASDFSDNNRGIEISKSPKEEAAYGLLVTAGTILKLREGEVLTKNGGVLAGETFTENGEDKEWSEMLTAERLKGGLSISKDRLDSIEKFKKRFNDGLGKEINMKVDLNETLSGEAENSATINEVIFEDLEKVLQDFKDAEPEGISVEPLFILALKELLRAKTRRWKNIGE